MTDEFCPLGRSKPVKHARLVVNIRDALTNLDSAKILRL